MYNIIELLGHRNNVAENDIWEGRLACVMADAKSVLADTMMFSTPSFAFVLVRSGSLSVLYDGRTIDLAANDLLVYAPAINFKTLSASADYTGYCLLLDEQMMFASPLLHHLPNVSYFPTTALGRPKLHLTDGQAESLSSLMQRLRHYLHSALPLKSETVCSTCGLMVADLLEIQERISEERLEAGSRAEEVFAAFMKLLREHYLTHHDLRFYADRLNITTTYLSRMVRQVSGHTVLDFIHHSLATEAAWRLRNTTMPISEIAYDLGFSDGAAFTKFFTRMEGLPPKLYRANKE